MSQLKHRILIVDDEPINITLLGRSLRDTYDIIVATNGSDAIRLAQETPCPDLILLDVMMPEMDGYEVCQRLKAEALTVEIPVIFISALGEDNEKLRGFEVGGVDYIRKPFCSEEVVARVKTHVALRQSLQSVQQQKEALEQEKAEREKTEKELNRYQEQIAGILTKQLLHPKAFRSIITQDEKIKSNFQYIEALSCSSEPVLVLGESGVGKELFARAIHDVSYSDKPWMAVNIAGFDDNVFSDTLFGHIRGAFTDATSDRSGLIERATGGTLFLDEIGELNHSSQVKLLRLLQEKEFFPLGSDFAHHSNCRIVVATNVDLKQKVEEGSFRRDLYFRLSTHMVEISPLRERKQDIPLLLEHFLEAAAREFNKKKPTYPKELPVLLSTYSFPGNVRELRAMVFNAMSIHQSHILSMDSFKKSIESSEVNVCQLVTVEAGTQFVFPQTLPTLKETSCLLVEEALCRTEGNQSMAAKLLGITPSALNIRLKKMKQK